MIFFRGITVANMSLRNRELHAAFKVKKLENMKISNVTLTREKPLACNGSGGEVSGRMEFLADLTW